MDAQIIPFTYTDECEIRITAKGVQKLYTALGGDMEAAS